MSDLNPAVADHHSETYPEFSGKIQDSYIEGYDPVSYGAPHSSLLRTSTWVGMGLTLSLLPAIGILLWGLATKMYPQGSAGADYQINLIVGAIASVVVAILAIVSVKYGRRYYRQYRKETGRIN